MKKRLYMWFMILACLALVASGCGREAKIVREGDRVIHDYSRKSEKISSQLTEALLEYGVLDRSAVSDGKQQKVMRLSSKEDVYLRWTITSYETEASFTSYGLLSEAVDRAVRRANARIIEQTAEGDSDAGPCAIFILGFSDRGLEGLAKHLETMQVVVAWNPGTRSDSVPTQAKQHPHSPQRREGPENAESTLHSAQEEAQLDLEESSTGAVSTVSQPREEYRSKEPPLSASERGNPNGSRPKLAIVIDDLGSGAAATEELMKIDAPLTVAVIPQGRYAAKESKEAAERGFSVLLHQPMEPLDPSKRPGEGGIVVGMNEEQIRETISSNLKLVPNAIGVNNHMGSRVTEDVELTRIILEHVFAQGLFFFDSRTSSNSVVPQVAREMGLPIMENARFLDHINSEEYVIDSIRIVARLAMKRGYAAAIGHVRPATVRAIQTMLPELDAAGVELVTLDALMPAWKQATDWEQDEANEPSPVPSEELMPKDVEAEAVDDEVEEEAEHAIGGEAEHDVEDEPGDGAIQDNRPEMECTGVDAP